MKFEETKYIEIKVDKYPQVFVYFLIKNGDVVYVGQTKNGLARPFSYKDKEYDTVKIILCDKEMLDVLEDKYIDKYSPQYNKRKNQAMNYSLPRVNRKIKEIFDYDISMLELKKIIREENIDVHIGNDFVVGIKRNDFEKIANKVTRKNTHVRFRREK